MDRAPMDVFAGIAAQAPAIETLRRAASAERVASAYLFEGPSGVGKTQTAIAFAKHLLGPAHHARIEAGNHPDARIFRPRDEGHRNLPVATIREEILPVAQYAPFEAAHAVLVFPEADVSFPEQHPEAANALLKTLEEPRKGVHFVLLSDRPERLLRTIRSRCQRVRFRRLPEDVMHGILDEAGHGQAGRAVALALAGGRSDQALTLMEDGLGQALLQEAQGLLSELGAGNPGSLVAVSERLSKHPHLELLLSALTLLYRDTIATAVGFQTAVPTKAQGAPDPQDTLDRASASVIRIRQCVDSFEWNASRQTALDSMLFDLHGTAQ